MPVIISDIITPLGADKDDIISAALSSCRIKSSDVLRAGVYKTSLDARKRNDIHLVSSVTVELPQDMEKRLSSLPHCRIYETAPFVPEFGSAEPDGRIVVIGFGPAGMFAALTLAENGYRPLVLERGGDIASRVDAVHNFMTKRIFCESTNIQFGEGGAGTFSDGKLTTRISDPLCRHILEKFVEAGAPAEILTKAKPHIGTDNLRSIVKNIREKIIAAGGEVRFNACADGFVIKNGRMTAVRTGGEEIKTAAVIAAIGHSARDTFEILLSNGVFIEPKPFSAGVRIEHRQSDVDISLYGEHAGEKNLPKGEYQLSYREGTRAVYTFCMCPGGYVVPAQSERDTVVTNGMSEFSRNGSNANSALAVSVSPEDFGNKPLDGVMFARNIERKAFEAAGRSYAAPCVTVGAFLNDKASLDGASAEPTYSCGVAPCRFDSFLPPAVISMLKKGLGVFSRRMRCFGDTGAVLTGPETRTSSPVRITRSEDMQALGIKDMYPCGEGAGYAGGIMSAAVDGTRCAAAVMKIYSQP